jgi:hypothetical protein
MVIMMSNIQKTLAALVFAAGATISGCGAADNPNYVVGTIKQEKGTVNQLVDSSGALFGNDSVKIGNPTYVLQFQTDQGLYTAKIKERRWAGSREVKPLTALAVAIEEGSRIKVEKRYLDSSERFSDDKIGFLYSDEILVLPKEK